MQQWNRAEWWTASLLKRQWNRGKADLEPCAQWMPPSGSKARQKGFRKTQTEEILWTRRCSHILLMRGCFPGCGERLQMEEQNERPDTKEMQSCGLMDIQIHCTQLPPLCRSLGKHRMVIITHKRAQNCHSSLRAKHGHCRSRLVSRKRKWVLRGTQWRRAVFHKIDWASCWSYTNT